LPSICDGGNMGVPAASRSTPWLKRRTYETFVGREGQREGSQVERPVQGSFENRRIAPGPSCECMECDGELEQEQKVAVITERRRALAGLGPGVRSRDYAVRRQFSSNQSKYDPNVATGKGMSPPETAKWRGAKLCERLWPCRPLGNTARHVRWPSHSRNTHRKTCGVLANERPSSAT